MESAKEPSEYQHIQASDVLLAIVAAAGSKKIDRAQLQKVAFLVSKEFDQELANFYKFKKYNYGPFCQTIYDHLKMFQWQGFIQSEVGNPKTYSIVHGLSFSNFILPRALKRYIKETVEWVMGMSFYELLNAIYYLFPEYHENSLIINYSEENAEVESFARALRQCRQGETYDAMRRLNELSRTHG